MTSKKFLRTTGGVTGVMVPPLGGPLGPLGDWPKEFQKIRKRCENKRFMLSLGASMLGGIGAGEVCCGMVISSSASHIVVFGSFGSCVVVVGVVVVEVVVVVVVFG